MAANRKKTRWLVHLVNVGGEPEIITGPYPTESQAKFMAHTYEVMYRDRNLTGKVVSTHEK